MPRLLGGLFFIEKIFLTQFVDVARADAALGTGGALRVAQHFGFRFIVALAAAMTVFAFANGNRWKSLTKLAPPKAYLRPSWVVAHLALIACLAWLGSLLFPPTPLFDPICGGYLSLAGLRRGRCFLRLRRDGTSAALAKSCANARQYLALLCCSRAGRGHGDTLQRRILVVDGGGDISTRQTHIVADPAGFDRQIPQRGF